MIEQYEPTLAERARTVVARSRAATMITGRCASRSLTVVGLDSTDGPQPELRLEPSSPVVGAIARCPVATLSFPGHGAYPAFGLTGTLGRLRDRSGDTVTPRCLRYRLAPLSARFYGADSVSVPLTEYVDAAPDPLAPYADQTLRHLEEAHADRVLAAVRVRLRPHALFAVPREIDRYGLGITVMLSDGVEVLRLPFGGGPVTTGVEAGRELRRLLTCSCSSDHPSAS